MQERPERCPVCRSHGVAKIFYGLPGLGLWNDPDFQRDWNEGRIVLGGDGIVVAQCKDWHCTVCGHRWGEEFRRRFEQAEREFAEEAAKRVEEAAEQESAAVRFGVLDAILQPDGRWTTCPHCGHEFSIYNENSWDGEKHLRCGTRLRLVQS